MNTIEEWKDIKDFEGLYKISNKGRIKALERKVIGKFNSVRTIKEQYLTPTDNGRGYMVVALYKNGKRYFKKVHRLVAEAFIPNPENKSEVNHIDGNKKNNYVENLEWVTTKENCRHRQDNNLGNIEAATIAKYKPVIKYDLNTGEELEEFPSAKSAAEAAGSNRSESVARVARGEKKSYKGYGYKYKK